MNVNWCTGEDYMDTCFATGVMNDEYFEMGCLELEEYAFGGDQSGDDCLETIEEDCMYMFSDVEGLDSCYYVQTVDWCDENADQNCNAWITWWGENYEVTCEEAEVMFYGGDQGDDNDDDCVSVYEEDCMDMFFDVEGLEACYYMESYDYCDEFNEESNYCNA